MLDLLRAVIAIQNYPLSEILEVNFVTVPAAIETEKQNNRTMRHGCKHNWADRERG